MIRDKVGTILGARIFGADWWKTAEPLDREGRFTRKTMLDIVFALCVTVEELENKVAALEERLSNGKPAK